MAKPITVTDADFEQKVLKSETPVVVDFWAPWCGPCRMVAPQVEQVAQRNASRVLVLKVNTDNVSDLASRLGIQGIPTLAVFGPTDPSETGPFGPRARFVREPVECSPCLYRDCPIDHRCMERIGVARVYEEAMGLVGAEARIS